MTYLQTFSYSEKGLKELEEWKYGQNWPAVYVIHNDKEAYIGETLDITRRTAQHLQEVYLNDLDTIEVITSGFYNKSSIIDLESFLIKYMSADGRFRLRNGNAGINDHNYFNKDIYLEDFCEVWEHLRQKNLVNNTLNSIENSNLFKYSPYKALSKDQMSTASKIMDLINSYQPGTKLTILVNGGAGTGKTILAVYLIKLLMDIVDNRLSSNELSELSDFFCIHTLPTIKTDRIGLVIPQKALAGTFVDIFKSIEGLTDNMVIRPKDVYKKKYDILIVDEAHRLQRRQGLGLGYKKHDYINETLGLTKEGTQLDWIIRCSDIQILFYDQLQSIRPSDIGTERFREIIHDYNCNLYQLSLTTQFRCKAGNEYISYIHDVLKTEKSIVKKSFDNYDLRFFYQMDAFWTEIQKKEKEYSLCRVVAGVGWDNQCPPNEDHYYITIEGKQYRFRKTAVNWVADPNSKEEIGDIHKIQGYDLCVAGVIFGPEIDYDKVNDKVIININKYYDRLGKHGAKAEDVRTYVLNIYMILMTRGIYGTYIYAVNENMREYLKKWF